MHAIKISAVHCLVLSQSTRVADRRTDRQNDDSQDWIAALRGRNSGMAAILDFRVHRIFFGWRGGAIGLAIRRSRVHILAGHHRVVALGKLLTHVYASVTKQYNLLPTKGQ